MCFKLVFLLWLAHLVGSDHSDSDDQSGRPCLGSTLVPTFGNAGPEADDVTLLQLTLGLNKKREAGTDALKRPQAGRPRFQSMPERDGPLADTHEVGAPTAAWLLLFPIILLLFGFIMYVFFPEETSPDILTSSAERAPTSPSRRSKTPRTSLAEQAPEESSQSGMSAEKGDAKANEHLSFIGAIVQLCGVFQGIGLVNIPCVLVLCGWPGLCLIGVVMLIKGFVGGLLVECMESPVVSKSLARRDFAEIGSEALGVVFAQVIRVLVLVQLFSFSCYFMIFIEMTTAPFFTDMGIQKLADLLVAPITGVVVLALTFVSESRLSWLCLLGNAVLMLCPILLLTSGLMLNKRAGQLEYTARPQMYDWAIAFSIAGGADVGFAMMPRIYEICSEKPKFHLAFMISTLITGSVLFFTAFIGYYFYGNHLQSAFITNIGQTLDGTFNADFGAAAVVMNVGLAVKVLSIFPLVLAPISDSLDAFYEVFRLTGQWWTLSHRFGTLLAIVVVSLFFEKSFVARIAIDGVTVTLITNVCLPILYYLVLFRSQGFTVKAWVAALLGLLILGFSLAFFILEVADMASGPPKTPNMAWQMRVHEGAGSFMSRVAGQFAP